MSSAAFSPAEDLSARQMADRESYRSALDELIDIGMELARLVRDEAAGAAAEASVAFDRVARAVRRTVRMVRWLDEPVPTPALAAGARVAARQRIIRAVEDTIDRAVDEEQAEALHAELLERLDGDDLDEQIAGRPVGEVIADICRDLGVGNVPFARPWLRRRPADLAVLHARAAAVAGATRAVAGSPVRLGRDRGPGVSHEDLARMLTGVPVRGG